jgi:hypothetical protein
MVLMDSQFARAQKRDRTGSEDRTRGTQTRSSARDDIGPRERQSAPLPIARQAILSDRRSLNKPSSGLLWVPRVVGCL